MNLTDRQFIAWLRWYWNFYHAGTQVPGELPRNRIDAWPDVDGEVLFGGIRGYHPEQGWTDNTRNKYNDTIFAVGRRAGQLYCARYVGTTDPGRFAKFFNRDGDLWLMPSRTPIGKPYWVFRSTHHQRPAFRFKGQICFSRDRDKNGIPGEPGEVRYAWEDAQKRGERFHAMFGKQVGKNSAGCVGPKGQKAMDALLGLAYEGELETGRKLHPFVLLDREDAPPASVVTG